MENKQDLNKLIESMKLLRDKRVGDIKQVNEQTGGETNEDKISEQITIKYLGKMELVNEQGELADKDVFVVMEEVDGQFQIRYYDENHRLMGIQRAMDREIMLSLDESFMDDIDYAKKVQKELEEKDEKEAQSLEELEEQAKQQNEELQNDVDNNKPQLDKFEVDRMPGPKIDIRHQVVDGEPLDNAIGLEGAYMKFVDADYIRRMFPDLEIPDSQRTVPLEVYSDGTANVIGQDKLQFSSLEGTHSTEDYVTNTNEGEVKNEQNIETFNIIKKGKMHTIAIGYDENVGSVKEAKYGRRDFDEPNKIVYTELEAVHEGPIHQDDETYEYQKEATGMYKGEDTIEATIEEYAKAMNIRKLDEHGYPTSEYDLEAAEEELKERWSESPDATLEELIDEGQKQIGPEENRRG